MTNEMDTALPRPKRKPLEDRKGLAWTYADEKRRIDAENEEWASKCGPVTVRYIQKDKESQ